jgi:4-aminobutyrate aminotransferase-like enzyme
MPVAMPLAVLSKTASGAHIEDIDGNQLLDAFAGFVLR